MFDALKTGLSAPISGMSVSFTSSLFGLASSLVLGFLDLQAGQAQNRFYSEFEEFLASHVQTAPLAEAMPEGPIIAQGAQPAIESQRDAKASWEPGSPPGEAESNKARGREGVERWRCRARAATRR